MPRPKEVLTPNQRALAILWEDGHESFFPGPELRAHCPCAPCKEDGEEESGSSLRLVQPGGDRKHTIADVHPVGSYALGVTWADGHDTGIYSFEYLRSLCDCAACTEAREGEAT